MKVPLIWLKDYVQTDKSPRELAASFTQLGLMLDKPLGATNVLDLEHRMDRADWLSILGCARDLAAFEGLKLKLPKLSTKPGKRPDPKSKIQINVNTPHVRRFQTRVFRGIKVGPSPKWLADRLTSYGMETINNIVDITNFVMVEYGQTMHAQDLAKLPGLDITIRAAKPGEKVTTLLGTEVKLDPDIFVLTSGGVVTVIGGIVGGKNTGVTETTTDIILDAGNYDSRIIRKTSRRIKIINESVSRNDKFLDPRLIDPALARATELILELAGGTYYENNDYYPSPITPKNITMRLSRLQLLSGMDLSLITAKKILKSLDYVIVEEGSDQLTVEIPYFRTDVEVEDDLVADILRIYNYTNIPTAPLATPVPTDLTPAIYRFEEKLRDLLVAQGAHEHITSSLVTSTGESDQVQLANALSSEQNALRTDLVGGLIHVLSTYKKHGETSTLVFEIGKTFTHQNGEYLEDRDLTVCGNTDVRDSLATLLHSLGINSYQITKNYQITINHQVIGGLRSTSYDLQTDKLIEFVRNYSGIVSEFAHLVTRDISLIAPTNVTYFDITEALSKLKASWDSVACKSFTKLKEGNNYLLTLTWSHSSENIDAEIKLRLSTLKTHLKIISKS
jgi:phenylalanyl-tRNA synthetase beta subunit